MGHSCLCVLSSCANHLRLQSPHPPPPLRTTSFYEAIPSSNRSSEHSTYVSFLLFVVCSSPVHHCPNVARIAPSSPPPASCRSPFPPPASSLIAFSLLLLLPSPQARTPCLPFFPPRLPVLFSPLSLPFRVIEQRPRSHCYKSSHNRVIPAFVAVPTSLLIILPCVLLTLLRT